MTVTLNIVRCPNRVAPETRTLGGGECIIGRGPGADWVLRDPSEQPLLSRRHCTLLFSAGAWTLTDTSTNGTQLNGQAAEPGKPTRPLRDGDRLTVGPYEIEVRLRDEATLPHEPTGFGAGTAWSGAGLGESLALDAGTRGSPRWDTGAPQDPASVRLPDDFAGAVIAPSSWASAATQPDHTPAQSDAIQPPATHEVLPADWAAELAAAFPPARQPSGGASRDAATSPQPAAPAPAPATLSAAPPQPASVPVNATADAALLAAFLEGAGMADAQPADAAKTMREAGAAFRAFVHGLREVLIARADVKSTFRIDQTLVGHRNNPLKFAAGDDDALAALLGAGRRTDMAAEEAVANALQDLRVHELATMAAMQAAVRELLARLDPERFRAKAGGALLPMQARAKAYDLYAAEFAAVREALNERMDEVFGRAFARDYERVVADIAADRA